MRRRTALPASVAACLTACLPVVASAGVTQLTSNGAWTWFNDPRGLYVNGRLYTGWITNVTNIPADTAKVQFASVDLASGSSTILDLNSSFEPDDHNNPALVKNPDGTLSAFYTWHRSEASTRGVYTRLITPGAGNSFTLGPQREIINAADITGPYQNSYANPYWLSNDNGAARAYLMSRGANFNPVYRTSSDGINWSASKNLVYLAGQRPYVKYNSNNVDRVSFTYTDGNPGSVSNNVYYAYVKNGAYWRADGTKIKDLSAGPLDLTKPAESPKVFDRTANPAVTGGSSWVWDTATGTDSKPVIAFVTFGPNSQQHQYHWARWNGTSWDDRTLVLNAGPNIGNDSNYSGGVVLDPTDPSIVYMSRPKSGSNGTQWELEQWKTFDDGASWTTRSLTVNSTVKNIRPSVPLDRPIGTEMVMWLKGNYRNWDATPSAGVQGYDTAVMLWNNNRLWDNGSGNGTWSTNANWSEDIEATISDGVTFPLGHPGGASTINLSIGETALALTFNDNYTFSGGTLVLAAGGSITVAANKTATINSSFTQTTRFTKAGAGTAVVNNIRVPKLVVSEGTLRIAPNGAAAGTSSVSKLEVKGRLDLTNNKLVVNSESIGTPWAGVYSGLSGLIQSGRNGGAWNGIGVITSQPDAANFLTTIAIAPASDALGLSGAATSTWGGQTVSASSALIMYTYAGDLNVDGTINADDYAWIDLYSKFAGSFGYGHGDINYDGAINADDYATIDSNSVRQGIPFATRASMAAASSLVAVPEPAVAAVLVFGLPFLRRRRQHLA
jgi:hypothetical protein